MSEILGGNISTDVGAPAPSAAPGAPAAAPAAPAIGAGTNIFTGLGDAWSQFNAEPDPTAAPQDPTAPPPADPLAEAPADPDPGADPAVDGAAPVAIPDMRRHIKALEADLQAAKDRGALLDQYDSPELIESGARFRQDWLTNSVEPEAVHGAYEELRTSNPAKFTALVNTALELNRDYAASRLFNAPAERIQQALTALEQFEADGGDMQSLFDEREPVDPVQAEKDARLSRLEQAEAQRERQAIEQQQSARMDAFASVIDGPLEKMLEGINWGEKYDGFKQTAMDEALRSVGKDPVISEKMRLAVDHAREGNERAVRELVPAIQTFLKNKLTERVSVYSELVAAKHELDQLKLSQLHGEVRVDGSAGAGGPAGSNQGAHSAGVGSGNVFDALQNGDAWNRFR